MKEKISSIVDQLGDPQLPWVWLPTDTEPDLWDALIKGARKAGFSILDLDGAQNIAGERDLLQAMREEADLPGWTGDNLNALKDALTGLPPDGAGWVMVLRDPDPLADNEPDTFEALLDIAEAANDARSAAGLSPLTLVTLDADEDVED
jgi:hypothetical protein